MASSFELITDKLFARFDKQLSGNPNGLFLAISFESPSSLTINALENSARSLGFNKTSKEQAVTYISNAHTLQPEELILIVETLDPLAVVALDIDAVKLLADAYHSQIALGIKENLLGRPMVCFEDFEKQISELEGKKLAWNLLKKLADKR